VYQETIVLANLKLDELPSEVLAALIEEQK
jgi:hypothetical protein